MNKPSTSYVDSAEADLRQTINYGRTRTQQTSKSEATPTVSTVTQAMSYGLSGQLERVVTTSQNGIGTVTTSPFGVIARIYVVCPMLFVERSDDQRRKFLDIWPRLFDTWPIRLQQDFQPVVSVSANAKQRQSFT